MAKLSFIVTLLAVLNTSSAQLGQYNEDAYYGQYFPYSKYDKYNYRYESSDDYFQRWYFQSRLEDDFFELNQFLNGEFLIGNSCPNEIYEQHKSYLRYLFRIMSLSYLIEAKRNYQYTLRMFGDENICQESFIEQMKKCSGKTKDMKKFITNSQHVLKELPEVLVPLSESNKEKIQLWLKNVSEEKPLNLSQKRLIHYCKDNDCIYQKSKISSFFKEICSQEDQLIETICSEKDKLYGISYAPEAYNLLMNSSALKVIKPAHYQVGCLRRFVLENKRKETLSTPLKYIYRYIYAEKTSDEKAPMEGNLFMIGALKEFESKGLKNIFNAKEVSIKETKKIVKKPDEKPKIEKIKLPKTKMKPSKTKASKVVKVAKKKPQKLSSFKEASLYLSRNNLDELELDMAKFKFDYTFTLKQHEQYRERVKKVSRFKTLKELKKFDKLGSKEAPVPLKFLKYLIDENMHQGLFNIINVIGDNFYVLNDIDEKSHIEKIQLLNTRNTNFSWQIKILKNDL